MTITSTITRKILHLSRFIRKQLYLQWNRLTIRLCIGWNNLGKRAKVLNHIYLDIHPKAQVRIDDDFIFTSGDCFNPLCRNQRGCIVAEYANSIIEIGHHVGMSSPCIWVKERLTVGNYVNIGGDCIIMDSDAHNLDWRIRRSKETDEYKHPIDSITAKSAPIVIEDDVFIGTRCIILKGVTIGARSVIAAGSVVTKSIPADCIAGGNPAKVIRHNKNI